MFAWDASQETVRLRRGFDDDGDEFEDDGFAFDDDDDEDEEGDDVDDEEEFEDEEFEDFDLDEEGEEKPRRGGKGGEEEAWEE